MHEFDEDTRVQPIGNGAFAGELTERWGIGEVPNGGYLLAFAMSALRQALPDRDPLSVTAHYLRPGATGPARVAVEIIKTGRRFSTLMARLIQNGAEVLRVLATYGDLESGPGPRHIDGAPPLLPPRLARPPLPPSGGVMTILERLDIQFDPATTAFTRGERAAQAAIRGWLRFADGRMPDVHSMGLIADAFPPAVFQILAAGWVPTLELTVHVRARPQSEWLACVFRTRFLQNGLLEEDGEIWDESGTLVAMSRQLAIPPRPLAGE